MIRSTATVVEAQELRASALCPCVCVAVWDDVYGFSMKPIKDLALLEPLVDTVEPQAIVARSCRILVSGSSRCTFSWRRRYLQPTSLYRKLTFRL